MNNIITLLGIIIWPSLLLFVIVRYDKEVRELIKRIKKISGGGLSAEITEEVNEIARKVSELPQREELARQGDGTMLNLKELAESDPPLALAKIRIEIERQLRLLYSVYLPDEAHHGRRLGPRSILENLRRQDIIKTPLTIALQDLINVTDKSIHGEDISPKDALTLVDTADTVLMDLEYVIFDHYSKTAITEEIDRNMVDGYSDAKYLLTTIIPLLSSPKKVTYELNQAELDKFLDGYNEYAEFIIDVRKLDVDASDE